MMTELTSACPLKLDTEFASGTRNRTQPTGFPQTAGILHGSRIPGRWIA
jgi:hypothetical protein